VFSESHGFPCLRFGVLVAGQCFVDPKKNYICAGKVGLFNVGIHQPAEMELSVAGLCNKGDRLSEADRIVTGK
jgi:hypothetical protein